MATKLYVVSDPQPTQTRGDWLFAKGARSGPGATFMSRHQQKSEAVKRATAHGRSIGRKGRGAVLRIEDRDGSVIDVRRYGPEREKGGGFEFF